MSTVRDGGATLASVKRLLTEKWPEVFRGKLAVSGVALTTGIPALDKLFPAGGIPCGQMLEITGGTSSGKTTLLYRLLARETRIAPAIYLDLSGTFFPPAAAAGGVNLDRLFVARPATAAVAIRIVEKLFCDRQVGCAVFDLVGCNQALPPILLHRLRRHTVRYGTRVIFLTHRGADLIAASLVSLCLEVAAPAGSMRITVAKSKISREGVTVEVSLDA